MELSKMGTRLGFLMIFFFFFGLLIGHQLEPLWGHVTVVVLLLLFGKRFAREIQDLFKAAVGERKARAA